MGQASAHLLSSYLRSKAALREINHSSWGPLVSALVLVNASLGESLNKDLTRDKCLSEFCV